MPPGDVPLFLYGTLKRGHRRHGLLGGSLLLRSVVHAPGYTLADAGGYPAMFAAPPGHQVIGELFLVDPQTLACLDDYEDLPSGEYRRSPVCVFDSHGQSHLAQAYLYQWPVHDLTLVGPLWTTDRESPPSARHP